MGAHRGCEGRWQRTAPRPLQWLVGRRKRPDPPFPNAGRADGLRAERDVSVGVLITQLERLARDEQTRRTTNWNNLRESFRDDAVTQVKFRTRHSGLDSPKDYSLGRNLNPRQRNPWPVWQIVGNGSTAEHEESHPDAYG